VNPIEKPFDPDDLPLEAARTDEDADLVSMVQPRAYDSVATAESAPGDHGGSRKPDGRPFRIRLPGRGNDGR
jgi:hypothetical protein